MFILLSVHFYEWEKLDCNQNGNKLKLKWSMNQVGKSLKIFQWSSLDLNLKF